ncbi:HopJ type III effector protein [Aquirhabdus parva]|uniref:HopJ type III effector protein n=1 Tax=Aquirhabdus parva TaxID=2283318 RepID=A0A345P7I4_9GAMM|nr:HopJ type III effector protein [Aquirhabdus parva]AXI03243.1 HopJ type III effector protein [Aquirhabdus parva]
MAAETSTLLNRIDQGQAQFSDVLEFINQRYDFTPTAFNNGSVHNAAGENSGSCRVFAFAKLHHLSDLDTLKLFAEHYQAVKATPAGEDHQNIRNFIRYSWAGLVFEGQALTAKTE